MTGIDTALQPEGTWNCSCGMTGLTTAFCGECGAKKPVPAPERQPDSSEPQVLLSVYSLTSAVVANPVQDRVRVLLVDRDKVLAETDEVALDGTVTTKQTCISPEIIPDINRIIATYGMHEWALSPSFNGLMGGAIYCTFLYGGELIGVSSDRCPMNGMEAFYELRTLVKKYVAQAERQ